MQIRLAGASARFAWDDFVGQYPEGTTSVPDRHDYHTANLGCQNEEGYFFAVGRRDNQLKVCELRIKTREIEDNIMATGMVVKVAVLGLSDPLLGNRLVAPAVSTGEGASAETLLSLCAAKLPRYKVPQKVVFVRMLPKNSSGKNDKKQCMDLFGQSRKYRQTDNRKKYASLWKKTA